jgi:regulator of cell morphogenesis and NO signaling
METLDNQTIGSIVALNYKTAAVFKKYSIDFCCKGDRTIQEACTAKGIAPEAVGAEVLAVLKKKEKESVDFNAWPLDLLADYIEKSHHRYVTGTIPVLTAYLDKINKVHGQRHPELAEVSDLFTACAQELTAHMRKEEMVLFPFIRSMVLAEQAGKPVATPMFGTVRNPIEMMMSEHINEGERFEAISALTNGYTPPEDACSTYKVAFATLEEFGEDLHVHIHLENNILFPKAAELEKKLVKNEQSVVSG